MLHKEPDVYKTPVQLKDITDIDLTYFGLDQDSFYVAPDVILCVLKQDVKDFRKMVRSISYPDMPLKEDISLSVIPFDDESSDPTQSLSITALMLACYLGDLKKVQILLKANANPNSSIEKTGITPLTCVLNGYADNVTKWEIAKILEHYGASLTGQMATDFLSNVSSEEKKEIALISNAFEGRNIKNDIVNLLKIEDKKKFLISLHIGPKIEISLDKKKNNFSLEAKIKLHQFLERIMNDGMRLIVEDNQLDMIEKENIAKTIANAENRQALENLRTQLKANIEENMRLKNKNSLGFTEDPAFIPTQWLVYSLVYYPNKLPIFSFSRREYISEVIYGACPISKPFKTKLYDGINNFRQSLTPNETMQLNQLDKLKDENPTFQGVRNPRKHKTVIEKLGIGVKRKQPHSFSFYPKPVIEEIIPDDTIIISNNNNNNNNNNIISNDENRPIKRFK